MSTARPQSLQHFIISIICILQLESCHLAGLIGCGGGGSCPCICGKLAACYIYVFEQLPAQHDANFFQYGVLFMDTLLFSVHFYDACI